jgi:DNA polymerase III delta prime subunit
MIRAATIRAMRTRGLSAWTRKESWLLALPSGACRRKHNRRRRGKCNLFVLLAGPDGSGKSTLADVLERELRALGTSVIRTHWRPGPIGDTVVGRPHDLPPRPTWQAAAALVSRAFAFWVARHGVWSKRYAGVQLAERGWLDQAVDPSRYRLRPCLVPWVVRMRHLAPRADLLVLLTGDATAMLERKPELSRAEIQRQIDAWRALGPVGASRIVEVDTTTGSPQLVGNTVLREIRRTFKPAPRQWVRAPVAPSRLDLRATPGYGARRALLMYRPFKVPARAAANVSARAVEHGLAPRVPTPWCDLDAVLEQTGVVTSALAAMRSHRSDRWIITAVDGIVPSAVLKVGRPHDDGLRREEEFLRTLGGHHATLCVPRLLQAGESGGHRFVALEAVDVGHMRGIPSLPQVVNVAVRLAVGLDGRPVIHGDLAPWNLLQSHDALWLVDWESATFDFEPMRDLTHYLVQVGALLGRWTAEGAAELIQSCDGPAAVYAQRLGMAHGTAVAHARRYCDEVATATTASSEFARALAESLRCES